MGRFSRCVVAPLLLGLGCGGSAFSSGGNGGAAGVGGGEPNAGGSTAATGSGGATGIAGGSTDASASGGSAGQAGVDAGGRPVDATTPPDVREAGAPAGCPTTEPDPVKACADDPIKCTYGTHPRPSCRNLYTCTGGHWVQNASGGCPALAACTSEPVLPFIGAACSSAGHDCVWDTGLYCRCLACPDMGCPKWSCFPPPDKCGKTPPNMGQACNPDAMPALCGFGDCSLGTKVTTACVGGVTTWTFPNCQ